MVKPLPSLIQPLLIFFSGFLVCPQEGATTITQLELVPRPSGVAELLCEFNVSVDSDAGFQLISWTKNNLRQIYTHQFDPNNLVSKTLFYFLNVVLFRYCI